MAEQRHLTGMTWDHARGHDPMFATSEAFMKAHPGVTIHWEKRSLQAFADQPVNELAGSYDLMVIDHPHVGEVARKGLLLPLDGLGRDAELETLARQSIGVSHVSYQFQNRQWALAIDAATPVACHRAELDGNVPKSWDEVLDLARTGRVGFALAPINALMTYLGMARNKGYAVAEDGLLMAPDQSADVLEALREITALVDPRCLGLDPIGIYEWMGRHVDAPHYSPWGYGYTNYSRASYCRFPLSFVDAPGFGDNGPRGTVIGGTGIAVSAHAKHADLAVEYAFWIAGADCQKGLFFESGGQPANAVAWEDDACNAATRDFFRNTRKTLDTAWMRPRYDGYLGFQDRGGDIVHACISGRTSVADAVGLLQAEFEESF